MDQSLNVGFLENENEAEKSNFMRKYILVQQRSVLRTLEKVVRHVASSNALVCLPFDIDLMIHLCLLAHYLTRSKGTHKTFKNKSEGQFYYKIKSNGSCSV